MRARSAEVAPAPGGAPPGSVGACGEANARLAEVVAAVEAGGVTVEVVSGGGLGGIDLAGVEHDSRRVRPGDLFVAWAGAQADGHDHVRAAVDAGAVAAVVERPVADVAALQLRVGNARRAAALSAAFVAGSPWRRTTMVGVTGTNGKTTTALLIRSLLGRAAPAAAVGTLGTTGPDGRIVPGADGLTTPGPADLARRLSALEAEGVRSVVVEASSFGLDQHRLDGLRFDAAVFTNLTRDHLDYHGTRERYLAAKARLLELGKDGAVAVVNADDEAWRSLAPPGRALSYGLRPGADARARDVRTSLRQCAFRLEWNGRSAPVELGLPGRFNVYNALAAAACALGLGRSLPDVAAGLAECRPVPGRLERIAGGPVDVFRDFAHTPDALEQVLGTVRPLVEGRLLVVFGAGGERDVEKRPRMGAAVSRYADVAVVTSDNPRREDPAAIARQVAAGVAGAELVELLDRREAIEWALGTARPGDVVLLAGKGHERVQIVGAERLPFDERRIVAEALAGAPGTAQENRGLEDGRADGARPGAGGS